MRVRDLTDKGRLLSRAKKLRYVPEMNKIYIVPDLTLVQQQEDKKLREEVKRLRENGVANVKIYKGKVLTDDRNSV